MAQRHRRQSALFRTLRDLTSELGATPPSQEVHFPQQKSGRENMLRKILYSTTDTAFGGRDGRAASQDGAFDVNLTTPEELGGAGQPSTIGIGPRSAGGFGIVVEMKVSLPGLPRREAETLVEEAHKVCPYSNATRGNVDVTLEVV